jgi:hypothetical protein
VFGLVIALAFGSMRRLGYRPGETQPPEKR